MAIMHANKQAFDKMMAENKTFLANFFATWCGPCKMLGRVFEQIEEDGILNVDIVRIDIDKEPELAQQYNVSAVPTSIFISAGKPAGTLTGFVPKEILNNKLKELK